MRKTRQLLPLIAALMLAACVGDNHGLPGFSKSPPDEFAVANQPALVIPPDFALRPPAANARVPAQPKSDAVARRLLGLKTPLGAKASKLEKLLLEKANVRAEHVAVREKLLQEQGGGIAIGTKRASALARGTAVIVNPSAEKLRINARQVSGEPINKGATPVDEGG